MGSRSQQADRVPCCMVYVCQKKLCGLAPGGVRAPSSCVSCPILCYRLRSSETRLSRALPTLTYHCCLYLRSLSAPLPFSPLLVHFRKSSLESSGSWSSRSASQCGSPSPGRPPRASHRSEFVVIELQLLSSLLKSGFQKSHASRPHQGRLTGAKKACRKDQ